LTLRGFYAQLQWEREVVKKQNEEGKGSDRRNLDGVLSRNLVNDSYQR